MLWWKQWLVKSFDTCFNSGINIFCDISNVFYGFILVIYFKTKLINVYYNLRWKLILAIDTNVVPSSNKEESELNKNLKRPKSCTFTSYKADDDNPEAMENLAKTLGKIHKRRHFSTNETLCMVLLARKYRSLFKIRTSLQANPPRIRLNSTFTWATPNKSIFDLP